MSGGTSAAYFSGFAAGVASFRVVGAHEVPTRHPSGATTEGRDWFLGCAAGLEQCRATFQGRAERPNNQELNEEL